MADAAKISNLIEIVRKKTKQGEFILMPHAIERRLQRNISVSDIIAVLTTGWHEPSKDKYLEEYAAWNYSIRGKTIDNRLLRIVVSFDEKDMLIITVIDLQKRR